MMSNQPSSLQQRQRLHRRQNSTPVAFEAMKVQHPATIQRQNSQHRRGQSIDSRSPIRRQHHHTGSMVSITNLGSTSHGQQILREAQQQRLSRPGQHQQIELAVSPQCGAYFTQTNLQFPTSPYDNMTMNAVMQTHGMPAHSQYMPQEFNIPVSAGLQMGFEIDENNQHYFQHAHMFPQNVSALMQERRMSHPDLRIDTNMRPLTPTQQIQTAQFPLTPAQTPFKLQPQYARSLQPSPVHTFGDGEIKSPHPVSMQKSRSLQGIVEQEEISASSPCFVPACFEVADMPIPETYQVSQEPIKQEQQGTSSTQKSRSRPQTPSEETLPFFDETGGEQSNLNDKPIPILSSEATTSGPLSPSRPALSPRRMSISDLNLEPGISASIEETNITLDDIAQYIEGPDSVDNRWVCSFPGCSKRFGRKENIKSHVQTHLGDRQFRCDHCKKCFVRGHDLKRHAKIHTGNKPYPCLCGNSFARHDALTRHRQRGMCIGAFDGIVKKVIKRGRPRKHRPELDDRVDKANKTRRGHQDIQDQYASSASSCSMSSWGSPPTETMDALSIRGQSPYDDLALFGTDISSQHIHDSADTIAFPPDMFSFTPPTSPGYSTGNRPSPSYREFSPAELASLHGEISATNIDIQGNSASSPIRRQPIPVLDLDHSIDRDLITSNDMTLQHSQHSLPPLSHSSSSPAADIAAFDFGSDDTSGAAVQAISLGMSTMSNLNLGIVKVDMMSNHHERNDFDNFLDFGSVELGLDGNPNDSFFTL